MRIISKRAGLDRFGEQQVCLWEGRCALGELQEHLQLSVPWASVSPQSGLRGAELKRCLSGDLLGKLLLCLSCGSVLASEKVSSSPRVRQLRASYSESTLWHGVGGTPEEFVETPNAQQSLTCRRTPILGRGGAECFPKLLQL